MAETYEQQMKDSDTIFKMVTGAEYESYADVKRLIVWAFVPDMRFSRGGISHAIKRLEKYYDKKD